VEGIIGVAVVYVKEMLTTKCGMSVSVTITKCKDRYYSILMDALLQEETNATAIYKATLVSNRLRHLQMSFP